jgi:acyl carrier protein
MGLDSVEIVMRIEETFGVDLPDDELGSIATVGDLYQLLLSKLDGSYACLSSHVFYRVRKAMVDVLGIKRRSIRPSTGLDTLLARSERISEWKKIEEASSLHFPKREHPRWFDRTTFGICASIYLLLCAVAIPATVDFHVPHLPLYGVAFPFAVALIFVPIGMAVLRIATPFLGYALPVDTVRDLARNVLSKNYRQIQENASQARIQDKQEVWQILREIIVDQLQVKEDEVVPDAHIARDLGCD